MNDTKEQIFTLDEFQKSEKHKIRESFSIKLESSDLTIVALKEFQLPYDRLSMVFWEKPEMIILSFCSSLFMSNGVQVYLGHKDRFEFGEFQINFSVESEKLKEILNNGGTFWDLIEIAEPGESEYARIQDLRAKHPGEKGEYFFGPRKKYIQHPNFDKVTAERLCFDPARILRFFDANLYNTLDFFLTYGNNDLVRAMQLGRLKNYFENISYFYLDAASTAMFRTFFFENSLAGREYYDLCSNAGLSRDDTFTGKRSYKNLNDETVLGKIVALHEFFHQNNKNSDLEALKGYISGQISTRRNCPKNVFKVFDVYLNSFDIRPQDFLLGFYAVWGRDNDSAKKFAFLMGELLSFCDVAYRQKEVYQFKVIDIEFFLLNIFYLPKYIVERLLEWKKSQKTKHERYRLFLELHTTLRFMLMNYNANTEVDILLRKILVFFEHLEEINLDEILTAYAAGHSACELEKYWNDISCSGEFKYFEHSGMTLLPPKSHQALANNILMQKTNEELAVAEAKLNGQREAFTSMNHSIKNLVESVTSALYAASQADDSTKKRRMINRASQGANLIASIAKAISLSYRQPEGDWKKDLRTTTEENAMTMDKIVLHALFHSVPNVFAGENFAKYHRITEQYFVNDTGLEEAKAAWQDASTADAKIKWIRDFLFEFKLDFDDTVKPLMIGDEYSTATHFVILFNEIFWNTIKAVAYVEKERRQCHVRITCPDGFLVVDLENAANADHTSGNTGFGHIIVENYVKMFEIKDFKEYFDSNAKTYKLHFSLPVS